MTRRQRKQIKLRMRWWQQYFFRIAENVIISFSQVEGFGTVYNVKQRLHEAYKNAWYIAERHIMEYEPRWKPQYKCNKTK